MVNHHQPLKESLHLEEHDGHLHMEFHQTKYKKYIYISKLHMERYLDQNALLY